MKNLFLSILVICSVWSGSANAVDNYYKTTEIYKSYDEINWTGKCFIQYEGKVVVNNEMCTMSLMETGKERDEFTIVVSKEVDCDDGTKNCSYFFYAHQERLFKTHIYYVYYNVWKDMTRAGQPIRPTQLDYYYGGENLGACFFKDNHKFCYEFKGKLD